LPDLNSEEKRFYGQLFSSADTDRLGVVTGENAVKFFEKSRLAPNVLGEVRPSLIHNYKRWWLTWSVVDLADSRL